ncbi:MAG TPA: glycosyltransferase [Puia sp.]|jgi:glycosyltransferase involved in cell wall biosynthesis|nr:glycosyltransferase [Puia sp.]
MDSPLVSVAMPVYNAEKYIMQAIDSVLGQSYPHFELVIVNDGSTDRSKEIIHSYSDKRIRFYDNEVNLGITKTRNKCIQYATGKYIAVLDNDDIALPFRLEKQVEFLESDFDYALCGSFYEVIDGDDRLINKIKVPVTDKEIKTYLLFENCYCNSSVMIQSKLLKERPYIESFNMIEDYYFLYTVSKSKKLSNLPIFATQYRVHGKNTSIEKLEGMRTLRKKMDVMILNDLGIRYSEDEFAIHTHFASGNFEFFNDSTSINKLESWLIKLYQYLESTQKYDMKLVEKIFIKRWILVFNRTKTLSGKIIFNKLFQKFHLKYMGYFLELAFEKYSKIKSAS